MSRPVYTVDGDRILRDGTPMLSMMRTVWGDGAPTHAELEAARLAVADALNSQNGVAA